jgi:hypothetical protein
MPGGRVYHFAPKGYSLCDRRPYVNSLPVDYSLSPAFKGGKRLTPCEHCLNMSNPHVAHNAWERWDTLGIERMGPEQRARFDVASRRWNERRPV